MQGLKFITIHKFGIICLTILTLFSGCRKGSKVNDTKEPRASLPVADSEYFQEIEEEAGFRFVHSIGEKELNNIIESSGGGAALVDFDQDGFIDIYVCSGTWNKDLVKTPKPEKVGGNHLFRNMGDGTFEDVTEKAGADGPWYSMGVTAGDYNNDGYPDLFISNYGGNVLLKNKGNGTFSNVTDKAGVEGGKMCSVGAVWFDYDNDSYLDLYVGNYLAFDPTYKYYYAPDGFPGPMAYDPQPDVLYHNNGDGTFSDVTKAMGIVDKDGRAMGVGAADYDADGYMDVFVANDHTLNYLWHNEKGKHFTDVGTMSGTAFSQAGEATVSMSVDFADFNNDGMTDLFVSDDSYCSLYLNLDNVVFSDKGVSSGISRAAAQFVGWSSSFLDYDNDGDVDIYKTNGALKHLYGQEDQLFENDGKGNFTDVSLSLGNFFQKEMVGRGACVGDYDNDGDMDIFVINLNDKAILLRNNKGNGSNWLMLALKGSKSNRDGVGAIIKVHTGEVVQTIQKRTTTGYLSQNDPRVHVGLGKHETADKIEIKWPSGKSQVLENVKANQILKIEEPQ